MIWEVRYVAILGFLRFLRVLRHHFEGGWDLGYFILGIETLWFRYDGY